MPHTEVQTRQKLRTVCILGKRTLAQREALLHLRECQTSNENGISRMIAAAQSGQCWHTVGCAHPVLGGVTPRWRIHTMHDRNPLMAGPFSFCWRSPVSST